MQMCRVIVVIAAAAALGLGPAAASALGFGRSANASVLGQPLDFSVALIVDPGESLSPECVGADVLAGDVRIAPAKLRVRLEGPPRGPRLVASVRTTVPIVEPVVTVRVTAGCAGQHSRRFVTFIEPARGAKHVPLQPMATGPLLHAADVQSVEPAAAAASAADAAALQREVERSQALEQDLQRARAEQASARQDLATAQARLREAEAARRDPPLVYGLATLVVLLLGVVGVLLGRVVRLTNRLALKVAAEPRRARAPEAAPPPKAPAPEDWTRTRVIPEPVPSRPARPEPPPEPRTEPKITTAPAAHAASQELGVDEVIDLDQQADFFVALGQDEAAIDLLMGQLRHSGGASPMPYLKLLEIYRRRGDTGAHERIRERFNRRFNAHAPDAAAEPSAGQSLDAYPEVVARLQAAWATPDQAAALLELMMGRSHSSDPGFDLPAFAELMLLHTIARDLREREAGGGVDLLLPLAEESHVISASSGPAAPQLDLQLP
jgi:hypothetical protein